MENPVLSAAETGTSNSNLYINIAAQGTGTLSGNNIDPKIGTADRLLAFSEQMVRGVNTAAENTLFSAGEIDASWVFIEILRTQASVFAQESFFQGNNITPINIYRVGTINGKYTVTELITYINCLITKIEAGAKSLDGKNLDTLKIWFRFTARNDTLYFFNQEGHLLGQNVSTINFINGTL
ncbi:MAG: hypothetical protein U1A05_01805, partial [Alphaproteobacteria bacterium]|nr:hypothetical protein [Alphaproteobacteria bacterium]